MNDIRRQAAQQEEAESLSSPSGKVIYQAILAEGDEELARPSSALFWSGLAAGLAMGFSMIAEGVLTANLPDTPWRMLIAKLGYSAGFLIVVLGRQQLFTENTLTPILPLLLRKDAGTLFNVARLWALVLFANLLGAATIGWVTAHTHALEAQVQEVFAMMATRAMAPGFATILLRGIFAGWLIALMVWLLPFAESGRIWVILFLTYLVGIGEFSHVIAGAVEVFTLAAAGRQSWLTVLGLYIVPTLIGNIIGGVTLVAMLNHAQVISGGGAKEITR
jgi:formate/nitrite transporter FocA (FNT family)